MSHSVINYDIDWLVSRSNIFTHILSHGNDYLLVDLTHIDNLDSSKPDVYYRFDGLVFLCCTEGTFTIDKNFKVDCLSEGCFMVVYPHDVIRDIKEQGSGKSKMTGLFLTRKFLRDLNFNMNVLSSMDTLSERTAVISLERKDFVLLESYYNILGYNAEKRKDARNDIFTINIARNVIVALFYNLILFSRNNRIEPDLKKSKSLKTGYVVEFMDLLQNNYKKEHRTSFYAAALCISPKYLSMLIKSATGKTAAEWIDECIILEAKNLLRFSGLNIQQISYELNFPNQSSFGKYFKHLTGMSPSQFQRT